MVSLDEQTKKLFDKIVQYAETIRKSNPCLYGDIGNTHSYSALIDRITDNEIKKIFVDLSLQLLTTNLEALYTMRNKAWEIRKDTENPEHPTHRESAPYEFIQSIVQYKENPQNATFLSTKVIDSSKPILH